MKSTFYSFSTERYSEILFQFPKGIFHSYDFSSSLKSFLWGTTDKFFHQNAIRQIFIHLYVHLQTFPSLLYRLVSTA